MKKFESYIKNGFKIVWSERALSDLQNIIDYLLKEWSEKEVTDFVNRLDKRLELIATNPRLFTKTVKRKNVRRSVLTMLTVIYYQTEGNSLIRIITLFNSRKKPDLFKI